MGDDDEAHAAVHRQVLEQRLERLDAPGRRPDAGDGKLGSAGAHFRPSCPSRRSATFWLPSRPINCHLREASPTAPHFRWKRPATTAGSGRLRPPLPERGRGEVDARQRGGMRGAGSARHPKDRVRRYRAAGPCARKAGQAELDGASKPLGLPGRPRGYERAGEQTPPVRTWRGATEALTKGLTRPEPGQLVSDFSFSAGRPGRASAGRPGRASVRRLDRASVRRLDPVSVGQAVRGSVARLDPVSADRLDRAVRGSAGRLARDGLRRLADHPGHLAAADLAACLSRSSFFSINNQTKRAIERNVPQLGEPRLTLPVPGRQRRGALAPGPRRPHARQFQCRASSRTGSGAAVGPAPGPASATSSRSLGE